MKKIHLFTLLIILPFLYVSQPAHAGECIDDTDCAADELCIGGFCEIVDGGGSDCIDDTDCFEDEICVDGTCVLSGGSGGEELGGGGGCSLVPQGYASMSHYLSLGAYLLALGGLSFWRRTR